MISEQSIRYKRMQVHGIAAQQSLSSQLITNHASIYREMVHLVYLTNAVIQECMCDLYVQSTSYVYTFVMFMYSLKRAL